MIGYCGIYNTPCITRRAISVHPCVSFCPLATSGEKAADGRDGTPQCNPPSRRRNRETPTDERQHLTVAYPAPVVSHCIGETCRQHLTVTYTLTGIRGTIKDENRAGSGGNRGTEDCSNSPIGVFDSGTRAYGGQTFNSSTQRECAVFADTGRLPMAPNLNLAREFFPSDCEFFVGSQGDHNSMQHRHCGCASL